MLCAGRKTYLKELNASRDLRKSDLLNDSTDMNRGNSLGAGNKKASQATIRPEKP